MSLEKCLFRFVLFLLSCLFFVVVELYELFIYILEIKPSTVTSFANIFSQFVDCLFVYAMQKLVSLIRSCLFSLLLFLLPWETDLKEY